MNYDMHVHTTFSDGNKTPREVVMLAKEKGLDGIAITDHDECRGYGDLVPCDTADISVYTGIEIAAEYDGEVHVLGLGIDWQNQALLEHVEKAAKARRQRAVKMLKKFNAAGIAITMEEVEEECTGGVMGRPHFAAVLVKKRYATSFKEAFKKYLTGHTPYYMPYEKVSIDRAAQLIIGAGGKVVLAHPGLMKESAFRSLLPKLSDMGFWGIEAYHPAHTDGQCVKYEHLAKQYGLFITAGSDFHGSAKPKISIGQEQRGGRYLEKSMETLVSE